MARGSGQRKLSTWERCSSDLVNRGCRFRLRRRSDRPWIYVREYQDGQVLATFSAGQYRVDDDSHVEAVYRFCLAAQQTGRWRQQVNSETTERMTWGQLANLAAENIRERIPKRASRAHAEGHLRTIATFAGKVSALGLERWAKECDPINQASPFRKRVETLAQIHSTGLLDLDETLRRLKALRPKGSARKRQDQRTQRPRVIPPDLGLQDWLDQLQGMEQWVFALIATYGLRPSEAWHAEGIDDQGWLTVPGDGLTKTARHYAPPVPRAWVSRYCLAERFSQYQAMLMDRWPLQWEERDGQQVPVNNSYVANYLYKQFQLRDTPKLWAQAVEGGGPLGDGRDWVRPYDLRHSYAVRCFTDPAVNMLPTEDHAAWMGHGADVHERIYLRWMPASRQKLALQERHARLAAGGPQETLQAPSGGSHAQSDSTPPQGAPQGPAVLPPDILARLAKLEQLEALLKA